jgi:hypothetical protein
MNPLTHIYYKFDTKGLYDEYSKNIDRFENLYLPYDQEIVDMFDDFKLLKVEDGNLPVLAKEHEKFIKYYKLEGYDVRPRYVRCKAGGCFPPHKDEGTMAAVNHILTDVNTPTTQLVIGEKKYHYKTAVFNTQREHAIYNKGYEDRVIIKLSFFDLNYEDVVAKLTI